MPNMGHIVLTIGASNYLPVIENWISHVEALNVSSYVVLCVDQELYNHLDPSHAVLMTPSFHLHLTAVASVKRKSKNKSKRSSYLEALNRTGGNKTHPTLFTRDAIGMKRGSKRSSKKEFQWTRASNMNVKTATVQRRLKMKSKGRARAVRRKENTSNIITSPTVWNSLAMLSQRIEELGRTDGFSVLMIIKHAAILMLLKAGFSVVWSDVDCVWLRPCALTQLQQLIRNNATTASRLAVDIAGQQGMFPYEMSSVIGTALCTGFFLVNPTPLAQQLIEAVKMRLIYSIGMSMGKGDQKTMNAVLFEVGDLRKYNKNGNHGANRNETNKQLYLHMHLKLASTSLFRGGSGNTAPVFKDSTNMSDLRNSGHNFVVAFLPYALFPRGDARTDKQQTMNKTELTLAIVQRNIDEWAAYRENACIWHMYSSKSGQVKVNSMQRDGVLVHDDI